MNYKKELRLLVLITLCLFCSISSLFSDPIPTLTQTLPTPTEEKKVEVEPFFQLIARENLKSLLVESDSGVTLAALVNSDKPFWDVMKETVQEHLNPKPLAKRTQVFKLLATFEKAHPFSKASVLDYKSLVDLELLSGPKSDMTKYVAASLDRTVTEAGKAMFMYKLVTPTADRVQLVQQQTIIKELVENKSLFESLDEQCKQLAIPENVLLSFWGDDMFVGLTKREHAIIVPFFKSFEKWINRQPCVVDLSDKLDFAAKVIFISLAAKSVYSMIPLWYKKYQKLEVLTDQEQQAILEYYPSPKNPWAWASLISVFYLATKHFKGADLIACASADGLYIAKDAYSVSTWNQYVRWIFTLRKCLHTKLIHVATYINNAQRLLVMAKQNSVLSEQMPLLATIEQLMAKKSNEVKHLLRLLASSTFKGNPSAINQYTGRVLVAYQQMDNLKHELAELMVAVGTIDAQLSIARLYKEFESKPVRFCFPTFVTSNRGPAIQAIDFWNPCLDAQKAVPNSLTLGLQFKNKRSVIVTGPNAGGKSTIMKGFILNILCAQSLGIAPAASLELTPFTTIMSYLNITDDLAAGNSHFKAGVIRARELLDAAAKLKDDEYGIFAADEVFNGTTHDEGQAAAFSLLKKLGQNNNVMVISPTHFPLVPYLENQTESFVNYRVSVTYNELGNIVYPYKLLPGITQQNVAFKILQEEGFGDEFLAEATRCLQH